MADGGPEAARSSEEQREPDSCSGAAHRCWPCRPDESELGCKPSAWTLCLVLPWSAISGRICSATHCTTPSTDGTAGGITDSSGAGRFLADASLAGVLETARQSISNRRPLQRTQAWRNCGSGTNRGTCRSHYVPVQHSATSRATLLASHGASPV